MEKQKSGRVGYRFVMLDHLYHHGWVYYPESLRLRDSQVQDDAEVIGLVEALVNGTIMPSTGDSSDTSRQEAIHVKRLAHWLKKKRTANANSSDEVK